MQPKRKICCYNQNVTMKNSFEFLEVFFILEELINVPLAHIIFERFAAFEFIARFCGMVISQLERVYNKNNRSICLVSKAKQCLIVQSSQHNLLILAYCRPSDNSNEKIIIKANAPPRKNGRELGGETACRSLLSLVP